uniref:Mutator family transposase n=1 Tax=Nonomuraea gerenzanensis TaxID=93944 RepID=A0A1M4EQF2_9ACTN|nr:Mobile element protein [Nonomuraea gerenzanensis]
MIQASTEIDLEDATVARKKPEEATDRELVARLVDQARAEGMELVGENGLLGRLTKLVLESALEGEITDHLGYDKHERSGNESGNMRNGSRSKTVITDVGPVEITVPRDRDGSFEPKIVRKRQRRLSGVDEMVISLAAKGLTTGEISAHLAEVYGAEVSKQTISTITDKVLDGMAEWQNRPLDPVYPVIFIDAIQVKLREGQVANRPIYVALAVTVDGERDILGLWAGDGGEGAKFWLHVLTEIKNRGVADALMVVCDGLKGLPQAIETVWPQAVVQTCVVHCGCQKSTCWFSWVGMLVWWVGRGEEGGGRGVAVVGGGDRGAVGAEDGQDVVDRVPQGAAADVEQFGEGVEGADAALVEDRGEDPIAVSDLLPEHSASGTGAAVASALAVAALFDRGGVGHDQFLEHGVQRLAAHAGQVRVGQRMTSRACRNLRGRVGADGPGT